MATETVDAMVEGGKASAAPPLGPALGPLGVNISQVVARINEKTTGFKGMQVPIKVIIDSETKEFEITVGTPPTSALIKKEAGIQKGSGSPSQDKVADMLIEQIIKIAKNKEDTLLGKDLKSRVKEIIGTCVSMGVLVEGVEAKEALKLVNEGKFDEEIKTEKTELTAEEQKKLDEEKVNLKAEMEARKKDFETQADAILKEMEGQTPNKIKARMLEAKIPIKMIEEKLPAEQKK